MVAQRITITVDEDTLNALRAQVPAGEVSAYVVEALRNRLRVDPIKELLAQLDVMYGPLTDEELAEGQQWLDETTQRLYSTLEQSSGSPVETAA